MGFSLKNFLEEAVAQIVPGDKKTAATVRASRPAPPAVTPPRTAPAPAQTFGDRARHIGTGVGLGGLRSFTGLGQGFSGLYDLASPGKGTNRFSKKLDRLAKDVDATAKAEGVDNKLYKGSQLATEALTFAAGGAVAKGATLGATKVAPKTAAFVNTATKPATNLLTSITTNLASKGPAGRIGASTIKGTVNPANNIANVGMTAKYTGEEASKGRDINPASVGANLAVGTAFNVGMPAAGAIVKEVARPTTNLIKNRGLVRPSNLTDQELVNLQNFRETAGTGAFMDDATYNGAKQAAQKAGIDYRNPSQVDDLLGAHRTFNTRLQQRNQRLQSVKERLTPIPVKGSTGGGGLADNSGEQFIKNPITGETIPNPNYQAGRTKIKERPIEQVYTPKLQTQDVPPMPPAKTGTLTMTPPPNGPRQSIGQLPAGKTKATRYASKTIPESNVVSQEIKGSITAPEYSPQAEKQGYTNSLARLKQDGDKKFENSVFESLGKKPGTISRQEAIDATTAAQLLDGKTDDASIRKATEIYEKLSEHFTAAGQTVQVAAIMSRRTPQGMKGWAISTLKKSGVKPNTQVQRQITELSKQKNFTELADLVSKNVPSSTGDKIINLWRAGLLTAPTTTGGNILGNTGEAAVRKGFVNPVATAADAAMGLVTGKRTMTMAKPGEFGAGFIKGSKEFGKNVDSAKYDVTRRTNYDTKAVDAYVNGVYRLMGIADTPFSGAAEKEALSSIAKAEAINSKLKGKAREQFIKDFIANPPEQALTRAKQEADYATFKNPTFLGKVAAGAKRPAGPVGDFFIPFTQVPAAIATRIVERTPVGIANQVVKQIKHIKSGGEFDQRAMSQAIGNGLFGPAIMGAGFALASDNKLTFGYPTDDKERALWDEEGKQPYSVKVGNRWYSLNYLQPFGTLLAIGGQAADAKKRGEDIQSIVGQGVATAGQSVANQSFLKGISGALEAVTDPERSVQKYVEQTSSSIVPNFVRSFARATDPIQRKPEGIAEGVKSGIPGLRDDTTPKVSKVTGNPLPAKDNFANQYLNPLKPSISRENDITKELRRLQETENGVLPTQFNKAALGKDAPALSPKEVAKLQKAVGPEVYSAWQKIIKDPRYADLSDTDKASILKEANKTLSGVGKAKYRAENNLIPEKGLKLSNQEKAVLTGTTPDYLGANKNVYGSAADAEYKAAKLDYENKKSSYTDAQRIKKEKELNKLKVGATFDKSIRDLYSLSKSDLADYLAKEEKGKDKNKMAEQLFAYDQALADAGIIKTKKFKNGIASSSKKSGGKRGRKGTGKSKLSKSYKLYDFGSMPNDNSKLRNMVKRATVKAKKK